MDLTHPLLGGETETLSVSVPKPLLEAMEELRRADNRGHGRQRSRYVTMLLLKGYELRVAEREAAALAKLKARPSHG